MRRALSALRLMPMLGTSLPPAEVTHAHAPIRPQVDRRDPDHRAWGLDVNVQRLVPEFSPHHCLELPAVADVEDEQPVTAGDADCRVLVVGRQLAGEDEGVAPEADVL